MNVLGLCAGIGGLELGLHLAEPRANPVVFVEQDEFCQSILRRRWPAAAIWNNVLTFDGRPWRESIDVLASGFPCQPWSLAGKRSGSDDARWIWPQIGELVSQVGPEWVFLENVPALIAGGGLALVLGTLASLGFDATWGVFSCKQLGASHKRQRVFVLGQARSRELQRGSEQQPGFVPGREGLANPVREHFRGESVGESGRSFPDQPELNGQALEHADCLRGRGNGVSNSRRCETEGASEEFPDAHGEGLQELWAIGLDKKFPKPCRCRLPLFAPGPGADWTDIPREFWPSEQPVRPMADGLPARVELSRRDRVKALGNAVSPPVAAVAWRVLSDRLKFQQQ